MKNNNILLLLLFLYSNLVYAQPCQTPATPTVSGTTITCGQSTTLSASGSSGTYRWFNSPTGGTLLGTGATFTTPNLTSNTTYYVEAQGQGGGAGSFNGTSTTLTSYSTGGTGTFTFSNTPTGATGTATLTVYYNGDLNSGGEYIDYFGEGNSYLGISNYTSQCGGWGNRSFSISAANINSWAADGSITIFADAMSSVNAICSHSFQTYGVLTYSYSSVTYCSSSRAPATVNLNPLPAPQITLTGPSAFCSGDSLGLTSSYSYGNQWTGGDTNTTIYVNSANTFQAIHTASNGCISSPSNPITTSVLPLPAAPVISNLSSLSGCAYDTTFLQSSIPNSILWSNGDTLAITPATIQGTYFATHTDINGCTSLPSNTLTVTVNPAPNIASANTPDICLGLPTQFNANVQLGNTNNASISSVAWTFGDNNTGNTLSSPHTYASTGSYPVSLIVTTNHGCTDTLLTNVLVNPKPSISSTTGAAVCHTNATLFNQSSTVSNVNGAQVNGYSWNFGDGNQSSLSAPNHAYAQPGSYPVQVVVSTNHGCLDTATLTALVHPNPVLGSVSIPAGCQGAATALNASVSLANVNGAVVSSTVWTAGDGGNANGLQTTYNYAQPGTYNAFVVATTNHGCTDTAFGTAVVNPTPQISSTTFPDVCFGSPTLFLQNSSLSNVNGAQITGYFWTFGDGTTSPSMNPTKTYGSTGAFPVSFTINTNQNCPAVFHDTVLVNPFPVINSVTAADVCQGTPSSFLQNSSVPPVNGSVVNAYQWNFGGGNTSTQANPSFTYANPGTYTVNLTVTTNYGCSVSSSGQVIVNPNPVISSMSVGDVCQGNSSAFAATAFVSPANGSVISGSNWDLGDGSQSAQTNFNHTYAQAGQYLTTLTFTSNNGCSTSQTITTQVNPNPSIASASVNTVCQEEFSAFSSSASVLNINGAAIAGYQWDFGDGNVGNGSNPNHVYSNDGNYNWTVTVSTNHGCTDVFSGSTTILPKPQAAFTLPDHCRGTLMPITNNSSIASGSIVSTQWNTSNGMSSTMQVPSWFFPNAGNYTVTLMLTSDLGCKDTLTQNVVVTDMINSNFSPTLLTTNTVHFLPDTLDPYLNYFWDFGDGTFSYDINPQKLFFFPGLYTVCLTITDNGCSSTTCNPVQLNVAGGLDQAGNWKTSIYPNPFDAELSIGLSGLTQQTELRLRDLSGRVLVRRTAQPISGELVFHLNGNDIQNLPAGMYMVSVDTPEGSQHFRVLKK
jgi:PKD repeat protein